MLGHAGVSGRVGSVRTIWLALEGNAQYRTDVPILSVSTMLSASRLSSTSLTDCETVCVHSIASGSGEGARRQLA